MIIVKIGTDWPFAFVRFELMVLNKMHLIHDSKVNSLL